jgi:tRNA 2-thiouridine synthesizing protein A
VSGVTTPPPPASLVVDGTGMTCVTLLLHLRERIAGARPGTIVHIIATDPVAPIDLPAWCHLTGHTYLGPVLTHDHRPRYALRLADNARSTHPHAPWRPAEPPR